MSKKWSGVKDPFGRIKMMLKKRGIKFPETACIWIGLTNLEEETLCEIQD